MNLQLKDNVKILTLQCTFCRHYTVMNFITLVNNYWWSALVRHSVKYLWYWHLRCSQSDGFPNWVTGRPVKHTLMEMLRFSCNTVLQFVFGFPLKGRLFSNNIFNQSFSNFSHYKECSRESPGSLSPVLRSEVLNALCQILNAFWQIE